MNESKEFGILVVGSAEGGAYFKPDGRNVSEPRGHLRFTRSVALFGIAIALAAGVFISTQNPVLSRIGNSFKSVSDYVVERDNSVVGYENRPFYQQNFADTR